MGGMEAVAGVIMALPGGVVRSGSKIGSKYKGLIASSNLAYCPTVKGTVESALSPEVGAVLEIVIDGLTDEAVGQATAARIPAAWTRRAGGILRHSPRDDRGAHGAVCFPPRQ